MFLFAGYFSHHHATCNAQRWKGRARTKRRTGTKGRARNNRSTRKTRPTGTQGRIFQKSMCTLQHLKDDKRAGKTAPCWNLSDHFSSCWHHGKSRRSWTTKVKDDDFSTREKDWFGNWLNLQEKRPAYGALRDFRACSYKKSVICFCVSSTSVR